MRRLVAWTALGLATVSVAMAGHVYGVIRENNQPVPKATVKLLCRGEQQGAEKTTDQEGTFRMFTQTTGSCTLELTHPDGRQAKGSLYSYDRPTPYDFDLVREGESWVLRRR